MPIAAEPEDSGDSPRTLNNLGKQRKLPHLYHHGRGGLSSLGGKLKLQDGLDSDLLRCSSCLQSSRRDDHTPLRRDSKAHYHDEPEPPKVQAPLSGGMHCGMTLPLSLVLRLRL